MTGPYDDIIYLPRPVSDTRPRMPIADRAAQFAPFAALTGFEAAVREAARRTEKRLELDESEKEALDRRLQIIVDRLRDRPEVSITYFLPDEKKAGGAYVTAVGVVKKIDEYERILLLSSGVSIPIEEIIEIDGDIFPDFL